VVTERHEAQPIAALNAGLGDPVDLFRKLDAELSAADALIRLSTTPAEQRRAALDGLQLARDVLADALDALDVVDDEHTREQLTRPTADVALPAAELHTLDGQAVAGFTTSRHSCACGATVVHEDEVTVLLGVDDELGHARSACLHAGHWSGIHDGCDPTACERAR
jgi:hypothetical protein